MQYNDLVASLVRFSRSTSEDSAVPKGAHWVTTEAGHHILIRDKDGAVISSGKASDAIRKMSHKAIWMNEARNPDGSISVNFSRSLLADDNHKVKGGETRNQKGALPVGEWVGLASDETKKLTRGGKLKGGREILGMVKFGKPKWITKESPEYKDALIEGTKYDIDDSVGGKWYFPVVGRHIFTSPITRMDGRSARCASFRTRTDEVLNALLDKGLVRGVSTDKESFDRLIEEHRKATGAKERVDAIGFYNPGDGKIYLDPDRMDEKTAFHEFSHPFLDKLRDSKTEAERAFWQRGIDLVKEMGLRPPDGDKAYEGLSEEDSANEVLADRMAAHGTALIDEAGGSHDEIGGKLYDYGRDFYRRMGNEFGVGNIDPDDLSRMTLDEWIEAANAHLYGMEAVKAAPPDLIESPEFLGLDARGRIKFNTRTWEEDRTSESGNHFDSGRTVLKRALEWEVKRGSMDKDVADAIFNETDRMYRTVKKLAGAVDEDGNPLYASFSKWCNAEVMLDKEGRPYYGVKVPNGDYAFNFDFSTVCKKRRPLDAIFAALIDRGVLKEDESGMLNLNPVTIAKMQKVIADAGLEVACACCFVDSKRYTIASDTYKFVAGWNGLVNKVKTDPEWWKNRIAGIEKKVNAGDSLSYIDRCARLINLAHLRETNRPEFNKILQASMAKTAANRSEADVHALMVEDSPDIIHAVRSGDLLDGAHLKEFGRTNAPIYDLLRKNGGAHKAKDSFLDNPWYSDILRPFDHLTNDEGSAGIDRDKAYAVGGVRLQSFSDFVPSMVFDYMQMMSEMAAKRLPMHVYTKEPAFVKIFGKTGAKINMSLLPKGDGLVRDAKGRVKMKTATIGGKKVSVPVYDIGNETFPEGDAYKLREGNPNVGTIMVGASDEHIRAALADPRIDMVIPYHKSGLNPEVAEVRGISEHVDYSSSQHTRNSKGTAFKSEPYDFYTKLRDIGDPRKVADDYISECERNGYLPKFPQFVYQPGEGKIEKSGDKANPIYTDSKGNRCDKYGLRINDDGSHIRKTEENYYKLLADFRLYHDDGTTYAPQSDVTITKDTYKGVLPHIRAALNAHEQAQKDLQVAIGTKENPGKLIKDLEAAFFTGDEAEKRRLEEHRIAEGKWQLEPLLNNSESDESGKKKSRKKGKTAQDASEDIVAWDALMRAVFRISR